MASPKYVDQGYWVRGYAEGDYVTIAMSSDAASSTTAAAGFLAATAAVPAASSATTFSPYRVQQAAIKSDGSSTSDVGASLRISRGVLSEGQAAALAAAGKTINNSGASVSVEGVMTLSGRRKWEDRAEPGDIWTDVP